MSKRLVLHPLLLVKCNNHLRDIIVSFVGKFADDLIGRIVVSEEEYLNLQQNRDQLRRWGKEWQVEFWFDKCEMLHFRMSNQGRTYVVNDRALENDQPEEAFEADSMDRKALEGSGPNVGKSD